MESASTYFYFTLSNLYETSYYDFDTPYRSESFSPFFVHTYDT